MRSRATLRAAGVSALALGLATAFPVTAGAAGKVAFTIKDSRVTEASGMARDTKNQVYWVVNDSGALGVVYGVDAKGKVKGTLRYNAFPLDAEAVAWNDDRLYVGDIGDNDEKRKSVRVYYFDDPEAGRQDPDVQGVGLPLPRRRARRGDAAGRALGAALHRDQGGQGRSLPGARRSPTATG